MYSVYYVVLSVQPVVVSVYWSNKQEVYVLIQKFPYSPDGCPAFCSFSREFLWLWLLAMYCQLEWQSDSDSDSLTASQAFYITTSIWRWQQISTKSKVVFVSAREERHCCWQLNGTEKNGNSELEKGRCWDECFLLLSSYPHFCNVDLLFYIFWALENTDWISSYTYKQT